MDREGRSFLPVKRAEALVMDSGIAELHVIAHNLDDIRRRPNFVHLSHGFQSVSISVCQCFSMSGLSVSTSVPSPVILSAAKNLGLFPARPRARFFAALRMTNPA